jgi:hypothetical protein
VTFEPWDSDEWVLSDPAMPGEPWADYFDQLFPVRATNSWGAFKIITAGRGHAQVLWEQRARTLEIHALVHGDDPSAWPAPHPTLVLYRPEVFYGACLGCIWLSDGSAHRAQAERSAAIHGADDVRSEG